MTLKYLLVLLLLLVAFWIWRKQRVNRRLERERAGAAQTQALRQPAPMLACLHCGTHLPHSEAVLGRQGAYCCPEHRQQHGDEAR
ncbi:PP0621 family protein [Hydrogenophaga sp.]|uniref:PP0621 family protein n=1 Tax=Hydrogenophaga sp. TaxID=1904254 RepID=UPI0025B9569B|nr:PP0621 family protein [Hydrogenophaga sp.]